MAYNDLEPIDSEWRSDFRMAYMASLITNVNIKVYGKKGAKMTSIEDFMPEWDEEARQMKLEAPLQSLEDMKSTILGIASQQNKQVEGKRKRRPPKPQIRPGLPPKKYRKE